jgi:hypothetical protein
MKQNEILFGTEGQEWLDTDLDSVVDRLIDESFQRVGESFDETADRMKWPLVVHEFKRMDVTGLAPHIANRALEEALETLDEEHSDPGGDPTKPTDKMKLAAIVFADAVVADYVSWSCVITGKTHEISRDEAKRMFDVGEKEAKK